ncbi:ABC transporter ATP-binding protein [Micromonospora sonneratiae]|uniref:ABC transporter ATP-binding protein n=1 Tax=Micromonospora sonneratiae TaxID=1184706 RepID=A0ABW3Y7U2_9ACTN
MSATNTDVPALEARGLLQRFGGLTAVDDLSLVVQPGAITGLIGPNGAGKTTVLNILGGLQRPTAGTVHVDGRNVTGWSPDRRARSARLVRTFQTMRLFPTMTVMENVLTAASAANPRGDAMAATREAVHRLGLDDVRETLASTLPYGRQRRVEIARAISAQPKVLLLDEPAAGLSPRERQELAELLGELNRDGVAILLVEHHMDLVHAVCSEVTVIDFGRPIFHGTVADAMADEAVLRSYLGPGQELPDPSLSVTEGAV